MKREILYKRPAPAKKADVKVAKEAPKKEKKKAAVAVKDSVIAHTFDLSSPEGRQMKAIHEWIESHPHFKWSRMVEDIGLKKSNFYTQFLKAPKPSVKADFLPKMAEIMANYGFKNNP